MKKLQNGRSMVEMLGVLAIIGVLSVGAIAGYQKAMFKYKLNKQAQQLSQIINAVAKYYKSFYGEQFYNANVTSYFVKLGEIPKEMIKGNINILYDVFNSTAIVNNIHSESSGATTMNVQINLNLTDDNRYNEDICINSLQTIKEYKSSIYNVSVVGFNEENTYSALAYYGDSHCTSNLKCLKDMKLNDMYELCISQLTKKSTVFKISWYN